MRDNHKNMQNIRTKDYGVNSFHKKMSLVLALLIMTIWVIHLVYVLRMNSYSIISGLVHAWFQSFLFVGLFVTAHDCMHGLVPYSSFLGRLCCFMFAGFSFENMKTKHLEHHKYPAQKSDPDYTDFLEVHNENPLFWIYSFMRRYFSLKNFFYLHIHVGVVFYLGGYELWKVFAFFAIPSWIASFQLFYFGTYLPHKGFSKNQDIKNHNARSNKYNYLMSLLTCFHFGYHREHHLYPTLAWWRLPKAYKNLG